MKTPTLEIKMTGDTELTLEEIQELVSGAQKYLSPVPDPADDELFTPLTPTEILES